MTTSDRPVVEVGNLSIDYRTPAGVLHAVDGVSFSISRGEVLGLVGESGCGKSTIAMALLGHLGSSGRATAGRVVVQGDDLLGLPSAALARRRGRVVGLVPQDPTSALAPHMSIGSQYAELAIYHGVARDRRAALALAREGFALVGLPDPDRLISRYPHELSGGQQQRVCIAMAIACRPAVLVLDEPTTGLDVTTQARIVRLLRDLQAKFEMAMLYVTHDLAVLGQIAGRVGVMYAGRLVELAATRTLFSNPLHPYSRGLMASIRTLENQTYRGKPLRGFLRRDELPPGCPFFPRCDFAEPSCALHVQHLDQVGPGRSVACQRWEAVRETPVPESDLVEMPDGPAAQQDPAPLIELERLTLSYKKQQPWQRIFRKQSLDVVKDLSFRIAPGEIFALVGESGSGKSTTARAISGLLGPVSGTIRFLGAPLPGRVRRRAIDVKRRIQFVFQNPDASLNPRERVRSALRRPLRLFFRANKEDVRKRIMAGLAEVRLDPSYRERFPDQLSGGERQRIAIARALVAEPSLMLCDEVLSALDVSVQRSIVELLSRLRRETNAAMLFISHDIGVVRHLADQIGVLFAGTLVEQGPTEALFRPPFHPYTEELLLAAPTLEADAAPASLPVTGAMRAPQEGGCVYAGRCRQYLGPICDREAPPWREGGPGHKIRCHIPLAELAERSVFPAVVDRRAALSGVTA